MKLIQATSWDAMIAFAEFAEDANFTRAAERLHISQPALHTKISNLTHSFEGPLYVRRGRHIEITELGRRVQRFARELVASAAEFESELVGAGASEPVVLVAGAGAYLYILGPGIRAFRTVSRGGIRLLTADGSASVDAVLSGRAQLGVAPLESIPAGLRAQPLTRVGQMLAMPSRHPLAKRRTVRLRDLAGVKLIVPPEGRPQRAVIVQMLQSANVQWEIAVETTGWELMLHFVRLDLGLSIVNECCRLPPGVIARPLPEMPNITYHIFHFARGLSKPAASLKRTLIDHAGSWKT